MGSAPDSVSFLYLKGKRPVSLIGFSLGARVIYYCLQELANDQGINTYTSYNKHCSEKLVADGFLYFVVIGNYKKDNN